MENDNNKQAESEQQGTENVDLHDIIPCNIAVVTPYRRLFDVWVREHKHMYNDKTEFVFISKIEDVKGWWFTDVKLGLQNELVDIDTYYAATMRIR
tara:strand:- start:210 stop:497 length:288 start_codon:yes stop_codon:yes gene_type:complete